MIARTVTWHYTLPMNSRRSFLHGLTTLAAALAFGHAPQADAADAYTVYVGTYTGAKSKGIYAFEFNAATGQAGEARLVAETPSPSFLARHPNGQLLYAVNEVNEVNGEKGGGLSAFKIAADGKLTLLNQVSTLGGGPCHLTLDSQGRAVLVANYGGGSVVSYRLEADGRLGGRASFIQHTGSSVNQRRQEAPHAHGIYLDAKDRFAYVPDLGLDKVLVYEFDASTGGLKLQEAAAGIVASGGGPRHVALHNTLPFLWSLNELLCTVTTFRVDASSGALQPGTTSPTLPRERQEGDSTAEIFVHPNGKYLYASNRGHDSITVFQIDPANGALQTVQNQPIGGKTPRNFALDPSGRWLLAAAQGSDVVTVFAIDQASGRLSGRMAQVEVPTPVCLVFPPVTFE